MVGARSGDLQVAIVRLPATVPMGLPSGRVPIGKGRYYERTGPLKAYFAISIFDHLPIDFFF